MRHNKFSARRITFGGVLTALSLIALYTASVFPASFLGSVALGSVFLTVAVIECGRSGAAVIFAAISLLGFLLVPDKSAVLLFTCFFGYYPILKSFFEHAKTRGTEWFLKLLTAALALVFIEFVLKGIVLPGRELIPGRYLFFLVFLAVFAVYDLGLSQFIRLYCHRISQYLKR